MVINQVILQAENCFFLGTFFFLLTFWVPEVITPEKWSYILHLTYNRVFPGAHLASETQRLKKVKFPILWDLKGSMVGRKNGLGSPVQKDQDGETDESRGGGSC